MVALGILAYTQNVKMSGKKRLISMNRAKQSWKTG
jgi:hypothetical protein